MSISKSIIITGSSGYVAEHLIPLLNKDHNLICIDLVSSKFTDIVGNIANGESFKSLDVSKNYTVINLAAARFDFDISADKYYEQNVTDHQNFLKHLSEFNIDKFIHIGSVACFDGKLIEYNRGLSCDDAYRSTKFLQGEIIENWCLNNSIDFAQLMPSAIFDDNPRKDTNIGKLQSISKFIPFIPKIDIRKSLTYMPHFVDFIFQMTFNKKTGTYITIEEPVKTVTEIIKQNTKTKLYAIPIPFLKEILKVLSYLILGIWKILKIDLKLYPNRVVKLFKDTSYDWINDVDRELYRRQ